MKVGNPEELRSRDQKFCRDFSEGDQRVLTIESQYGTFNLVIDKQDLDLTKTGLRIARRRQKNGTIDMCATASKNGMNRRNNDCRFVHVLVVEKALGRPLKNTEVVHHLDGNSFNCNRENLLVSRNSEHGRLHMSMSVAFAQEHFRSPLDDGSLQLLKKLLNRKTRVIRGILQVIGPGVADEGIVQT